MGYRFGIGFLGYRFGIGFWDIGFAIGFLVYMFWAWVNISRFTAQIWTFYQKYIVRMVHISMF